MASTLVDGLRLPLAIGGHPAIDFCNTRAGWAAATPKEYLVDYRHLAVWAREAGLLTASTTRDLLSQAARQPARVLQKSIAGCPPMASGRRRPSTSVDAIRHLPGH